MSPWKRARLPRFIRAEAARFSSPSCSASRLLSSKKLRAASSSPRSAASTPAPFKTRARSSEGFLFVTGRQPLECVFVDGVEHDEASLAPAALADEALLDESCKSAEEP